MNHNTIITGISSPLKCMIDCIYGTLWEQKEMAELRDHKKAELTAFRQQHQDLDRQAERLVTNTRIQTYSHMVYYVGFIDR
jgi:hypothetical protein